MTLGKMANFTARLLQCRIFLPITSVISFYRLYQNILHCLKLKLHVNLYYVHTIDTFTLQKKFSGKKSASSICSVCANVTPNVTIERASQHGSQITFWREHFQFPVSISFFSAGHLNPSESQRRVFPV